MSEEPRTLLSEQEYLSLERQAEFKSEYLAGEVFAMVGAARRHTKIVANLIFLLESQLRNGTCNVFPNDLRVKVPATGLYTYPDLVVTCDDEEFEDGELDTLLNPLVILEVLSPSTEAYDRGKKFEHYQSIESLSTYVLVSQEDRRIEWYVRQEGGTWLYTEAHEEGSRVRLGAISCELDLEDVYLKV